MQLQKHTSKVPLAECWRLLAGESIGRLALSVRALPVLLPVQYYLDGDIIAICLGHHDVPNQSVDRTVAAFTVDAVDRELLSGWVVQCLGTLSTLGSPDGQADCGQPVPGVVVRFEPAVITGQLVQLCPFLSL